jgi:hypothetical protein
MPSLKNVLLYLHRGIDLKSLPREAGRDFVIVPIDYSEDIIDNFININL